MAFLHVHMNVVVYVKMWHKTVEKSIPYFPIHGHYQAHVSGVNAMHQLQGYHMVENKIMTSGIIFLYTSQTCH